MRIVLLLCSLLVFGCSSSEKSPKSSNKKGKSNDELAFTFQRTACYGTCPEYTLRVYMNGKAELEGTKNTEFIGTFDCQDCDEPMMAAVVTMAGDINFWEMDDIYGDGVMDLPSTITTLYVRSPKKVTHILDGPEELKELESLIFDLYFKRVWVKKEK